MIDCVWCCCYCRCQKKNRGNGTKQQARSCRIHWHRTTTAVPQGLDFVISNTAIGITPCTRRSSDSQGTGPRARESVKSTDGRTISLPALLRCCCCCARRCCCRCVAAAAASLSRKIIFLSLANGDLNDPFSGKKAADTGGSDILSCLQGKVRPATCDMGPRQHNSVLHQSTSMLKRRK